MAEIDYYIRQGDVGVAITDTLKDADGNPVLIQGATVAITVVPLGGGTPIVNTAAINLDDGTAPNKGKVSYTWTAGQTNTPGLYAVSWIVTFGGGAVQTYPNDDYIIAYITPDAPTSAGQDYITVEELKGAHQITSSFANDTLAWAISAASRTLDDLTGRRFYADADVNQVRYYTPNGRDGLYVDDIVTLTSLQTDANGDGTFETTWTLNTDFLLEPLNAAADAEPYYLIRRHPSGTRTWPAYPRSVKITAKFGWAAVPTAAKTATTKLATRFLLGMTQAPHGVVSLGPDGTAVRVAKSDPDVMAMVEVLSKRVLLV